MLSSDGITGPAIPTPDAQEFKTYTFEYSLFPHQKGWKEADSFKPANEFNNELISFQIPAAKGKGTFPSQFSFVEIKPENLILVTLKKSEEGDEVILRFFETKGEETQAEIKVFRRIKRAIITNLLEEDEYKLEPEGDILRMKVKPFEIITLRLRLQRTS